jgi:uncharacterized Zn finger protein
MCKHIAAVLYGVGARLDERPELLFRLRAVDETELLFDLGSALPDTRTKRDAAQTLVDNDLAALFGLDMEESKAPAPSHSAGATSAGRRKKTRKSVVQNLSVAAAPAVDAKANANAVTPAQEKKVGSDKQGHRPTAKTSTKARSAQATQKHTIAPTRSAAKKTVTAAIKSAAKSATKPSAEIRKAQAKATCPLAADMILFRESRPPCQSTNFRLGGQSDHPPRPSRPRTRSGGGARETVDHQM